MRSGAGMAVPTGGQGCEGRGSRVGIVGAVGTLGGRLKRRMERKEPGKDKATRRAIER